MDLYEYQGKQYFARFGIPTSAGGVADTVDEAVAQAEAAGYPVVVKAQVKVGGRGKAGGVKLADNAEEARLHAGNILGLDIKGHVVKRLWGFSKVRYRGLAKNTARLFTAFALSNLYMLRRRLLLT